MKMRMRSAESQSGERSASAECGIIIFNFPDLNTKRLSVLTLDSSSLLSFVFCLIYIRSFSIGS